jgi:hypothetical protein
VYGRWPGIDSRVSDAPGRAPIRKRETGGIGVFTAPALEAATGIVFQVRTGDFDYSIDDVELVP